MKVLSWFLAPFCAIIGLSWGVGGAFKPDFVMVQAGALMLIASGIWYRNERL